MKDLEEKFISYLMHDKKYIAEVGDTITSHHLPQLHSVYELIYRYYAKYGGIIDESYAVEYYKRLNFDNSVIIKWETTMAAIAKYSHFDDCEWKAVLDEIDLQYQKYVVRDIAQIVVDSNLKDANKKRINKIVENIKQDVSKLETNRTKAVVVNLDDVDEYKEYTTQDDLEIKYKSGFQEFDDENEGFRADELIYIIGRQGTGKSVLMLNLAYNMWAQGLNVILFSLEISEKDYRRRLTSRATRIPIAKLKKKTLDTDEQKILMDYVDKRKQGVSLNGDKIGKFTIVDIPQGCTPAYITEQIRQAEAIYDCVYHTVVIDYAGIMQPNIKQKEVRHNKAQIALELKQYARSTHKLVITAEQMNREGHKMKEIDTSAVAESDGVTNHIDWGFAIKLDTINAGRICTIKARDGIPVDIFFQKRYDIMYIQENEKIEQWNIS